MSKVIAASVVVQTDSAMISEMSYSQDASTLIVTFRKGGKYLYSDVSSCIWKSLVAETTESIGRYFHANIRKYPTLYPFIRL